jgi:hypothetical protein
VRTFFGASAGYTCSFIWTVTDITESRVRIRKTRLFRSAYRRDGRMERRIRHISPLSPRAEKTASGVCCLRDATLEFRAEPPPVLPADQ